MMHNTDNNERLGPAEALIEFGRMMAANETVQEKMGKTQERMTDLRNTIGKRMEHPNPEVGDGAIQTSLRLMKDYIKRSNSFIAVMNSMIDQYEKELNEKVI